MDACGDYYATLRVSPDADTAALRRAYRALMRQYHPDVNKDAGAPARCHAINEAYECLSDTNKRADYDAMRWAFQYRARPDPAPPPRHARAARPMPTFTPRYSMRFGEELTVQNRWRKVAVIALGMLVTLLTFTVTSRVDLSSVAAATPQDVVVQTDMKGPRVARP